MCVVALLKAVLKLIATSALHRLAALPACLTLQQHGVAIAEKSVALGDGVLVQGHDVSVASQRTDQHHEGGFRQVEVGN